MAEEEEQRMHSTISRRRLDRVVATGAFLTLGLLMGCSSNSGAGGQGATDNTVKHSGVGGQGVTDNMITLGGTTPLTGPAAATCHPITGATTAYLDYVNSKGGVNGRKISWKPLDDAYDPARAASNARTLVGSDIFAIFGGCGSLQPPAIIPQAVKAGIPYLWPSALLPDMYVPAKPGVFASRPSYTTHFDALLPYAFEKYGPGSVSSMLLQAPGMDQAVADLKSATGKSGKTYNDNSLVTPGTADFTPYVLKLKQQDPDYVVTNLSTTDAAKFLQAAASQGFAPKKMYLNAASMATAQVTGPFQKGDKNALAGNLLVSSEVLPPESKESQDCVKALKEFAPDINPDTPAMAGCVVAVWLAAALDKTPEPLTRDAFITTLQSMKDVQLAPNAGPVSMSATNHLTPSSLYILQLGNDGVFTQAAQVPISGTK